MQWWDEREKSSCAAPSPEELRVLQSEIDSLMTTAADPLPGDICCLALSPGVSSSIVPTCEKASERRTSARKSLFFFGGKRVARWRAATSGPVHSANMSRRNWG